MYRRITLSSCLRFVVRMRVTVLETPCFPPRPHLDPALRSWPIDRPANRGCPASSPPGARKPTRPHIAAPLYCQQQAEPDEGSGRSQSRSSLGIRHHHIRATLLARLKTYASLILWVRPQLVRSNAYAPGKPTSLQLSLDLADQQGTAKEASLAGSAFHTTPSPDTRSRHPL